ncbi:hypothetical protein EUGRSUZ_A02707 [Eucalyptus grandis]|uniref:Uncharacterized protein n=2 Tax=Eucalyptus grandis TaxID=71139 RepID=A0ACC3M700_EUCGR|nr:hypothetical protein EUGRSUZ_A02707 [Eucalyptus grandis]
MCPNRSTFSKIWKIEIQHLRPNPEKPHSGLEPVLTTLPPISPPTRSQPKPSPRRCRRRLCFFGLLV